jgi:hypothetical protein
MPRWGGRVPSAEQCKIFQVRAVTDGRGSWDRMNGELATGD